MREVEVKTSISACCTKPAGLFPEAVSAFTLYSVKHKFLLLLLNLVRGGESVVLIRDGKPNSYMCEIMKHDS